MTARFSAPVQTGPGAHPASCTTGTGSFLGGKAAGAWSWPPTASSAKVKERVELYIYSSFVDCSGVKFTFTFTHFCYRLSQPQGHSAAGWIMSMKNSNDTVRNRTRGTITKYQGVGESRAWEGIWVWKGGANKRLGNVLVGGDNISSLTHKTAATERCQLVLYCYLPTTYFGIPVDRHQVQHTSA